MGELMFGVVFVTLYFLIAGVCTLFKLDPTKLFKIN